MGIPQRQYTGINHLVATVRGILHLQTIPFNEESSRHIPCAAPLKKRTAHGEAVNLFVGRPFEAVVGAKNGQFRRPEKGVLHSLKASECACDFLDGIAFTQPPCPHFS
jgi:hypothetical protein